MLDLRDLLFVDVGGARAIDRALLALDDGCPVILRAPRPSARKVFHATGFMKDGQIEQSPALPFRLLRAAPGFLGHYPSSLSTPRGR